MVTKNPSEEEVQIFLQQALYQQAMGLTQTALATVSKITSLEGLDSEDLKGIAAIQYQAGDCQATLTTLGEQEDIMSLMLRGKAEFGLGQFAKAAALLGKAKGKIASVDVSIKPELDRQCTVWTNKSRLELSSTRSIGDINMGAYLNTTTSQTPDMFKPTAATQPSAQSKSVASAQVEEVKSDGPAKLDLKCDWYQSMTHVFVTYKIKSGGAALAAGSLASNITDQGFVLENSANGEILVSIDLANPVDASQSSVSCTAKRIEVKLKKTADNLNWVALESQNVSGASAIPAAAGGPVPAYPSSNKKKKDWGALDREIEKELADEKPEGDAALNGLFKQIYERSDEETRRAMIKSYQTSGGTVLSTNWGEVHDKDYEGKDRPEAPKGQSWANEQK